ncbi:MAG: MarR family transcriptional regulator [Candidimonas sp.]|nr:MAG: MarR family transcriptional regulator [Candidimonas sp.]
MPEDLPQLRIMQQLGRTYRALQMAFDAKIGQPMPRWRILVMLRRRGEMSQKELACALRVDPASLTRQLKTIERLGWVRRRNDEADNRLTNVVLTPAGVGVVEETMPRRLAFFERVLADFSHDDLARLGALLDQLEQRVREELA